MREIAWLRDIHATREAQTDFYTARVVAMLMATNSKHPKYNPSRYMMPAHVAAMGGRDRGPAEPMTGEQVYRTLEARGVPMIEFRFNRS